MKKIPLASPLLLKEEAILAYEVVKSGWLSEGKFVKKFEDSVKKFLGIKYAVAMSNGTSALTSILIGLGIGKGDEVIIPSFTCSPTLDAVITAGAKAIFADIEKDTFNMDPSDVKNKISNKTKAVIPIHYGGHPARLNELKEICEENNIYLIEDNALAFGAEYNGKKIGTFGIASALSFAPNKTITTGEGGMVVTNNRELYDNLLLIKRYGQNHQKIPVTFGFNFKMTDIQGALGYAQMKKIKRIIYLKRRNAKFLTQYLEKTDIVLPVESPSVKHVYTFYPVIFRNKNTRERAIKKLNQENIDSRIYFHPLHMTKLFPEIKIRLPNTEEIFERILCLPSSPTLTVEDIERIANTLSFLKGR